MESTVHPLDPVTEKPTNEDKHQILILSTVIPTLGIVLLLMTIVQVRRRIRRVNKLVRHSVYVIPNTNFEANVPDPTQSQDFQKKHKKNHHPHVKNKVKKLKNNSQSTNHFPREPVYKSQETPSYIVPFSALPANFDYSLKNVEVHSDFVIIKDLDILQRYWYESEYKPEEYKKPPSYNPKF